MLNFPDFTVEKCAGCDAQILGTGESSDDGRYWVGRDGDDFEMMPDYGWANFPKDAEGMLCNWCDEQELGDHASTIVRFLPVTEATDYTHETIRFGDHKAMWVGPEEAYGGDELPDWFTSMIKERKYVHTDGWRGYFDTKPEGDFTKISDGWVTGYPDDTVQYKMTAADLYEKLHEGMLVPDVEIFWLFEPTSNVFSTATEIFVRTKDHEAAVAWFEKVGFPVKAIERALG